MDLAQTLRDLGFTYVSFDMARTVRITAWRGSERKTYTAYGPDIGTAVSSMMQQINKQDDWEDLL